MNPVALFQCVLAATSFAEATVVKKNAKGAMELGASTRLVVAHLAIRRAAERDTTLRL